MLCQRNVLPHNHHYVLLSLHHVLLPVLCMLLLPVLVAVMRDPVCWQLEYLCGLSPVLNQQLPAELPAESDDDEA